MDSFVQQIAGIKISVKGVPIKLKKALLLLLFFIYTLNTITILRHLNCQNTLQFPMFALLFKTYLQTGHLQLPLSQLSVK